MCIRDSYSLASTIAVQASAVLERRYRCILDSNEVAYLAPVSYTHLDVYKRQALY